MEKVCSKYGKKLFKVCCKYYIFISLAFSPIFGKILISTSLKKGKAAVRSLLFTYRFERTDSLHNY